MNPVIVADWDGTHLWAQWDPINDATYEVRLRFREKGAQDWEDWKPVIRPARAWLVHPVNRPTGTAVQADVRIVGAPDSDWQRATEGKFIRSLCKFEFSSQKKAIHFIEGVKFHTLVDGAACSYQLREEIEVAAGETKIVELEAVASDGYAQLDKPGDFILRPALGLSIRNIEPSRNDLEITGRDFSELTMAKRDGPFTMVFLSPENIR